MSRSPNVKHAVQFHTGATEYGKQKHGWYMSLTCGHVVRRCAYDPKRRTVNCEVCSELKEQLETKL